MKEEILMQAFLGGTDKAELRSKANPESEARESEKPESENKEPEDEKPESQEIENVESETKESESLEDFGPFIVFEPPKPEPEVITPVVGTKGKCATRFIGLNEDRIFRDKINALAERTGYCKELCKETVEFFDRASVAIWFGVTEEGYLRYLSSSDLVEGVQGPLERMVYYSNGCKPGEHRCVDCVYYKKGACKKYGEIMNSKVVTVKQQCAVFKGKAQKKPQVLPKSSPVPGQMILKFES